MRNVSKRNRRFYRTERARLVVVDNREDQRARDVWQAALAFAIAAMLVGADLLRRLM